MVYCVARKGVTGLSTSIDSGLADYLAACKSDFKAPLAVGFGIRQRSDVEALIGKADIAVVGSEMLRVLDRDGVAGVQRFVEGLVG
jgi:tryptophan synthase alpha chain